MEPYELVIDVKERILRLENGEVFSALTATALKEIKPLLKQDIVV